MKPDCYKCKWRRNIPGDAHSSCAHPANGKVANDPLLQALAIFASVGRTDPIGVETGLRVKGNPRGILKGWFNWPFNFDPIWLESCDGFTSKEEEEKDVQ